MGHQVTQFLAIPVSVVLVRLLHLWCLIQKKSISVTFRNVCVSYRLMLQSHFFSSQVEK